MRKSAAFTVLILLSVLVWGQDSLWDPSSGGYYTGRVRLKVGDLLRLNLDTEASLSFSSSKTSDKFITFEFTKASQGGNPLEFLPGLKSGDNLKLLGKNEFKAKNAALMVTVKEIHTDGSALIEGVRTISLPSGTDNIRLTGVVDARDVRGRELSLTAVADLHLAFSTLSESTSAVFTPSDFETNTSTLTPEKQRDLLLKYYNRFLDVLFPQE